jgi:hypothetical protein
MQYKQISLGGVLEGISKEEIIYIKREEADKMGESCRQYEKKYI